MANLVPVGGTAAAINPIIPEPNEIFWGVITYTTLYLLVKFVLLPPFRRVLDERSATIAADRDAADLARQKLAGADSEVHDQLADVRAEAASIIEQARQEASVERERLIGRAEREVEAMQDLANDEVTAARERALAGIAPQVSDLAIGAASSVLNRPVTLAEAQPALDRVLNSSN